MQSDNRYTKSTTFSVKVLPENSEIDEIVEVIDITVAE